MSTRLLEFINKYGVPIQPGARLTRIGSGADGEVWDVVNSNPHFIIKFGKQTNASSVLAAKQEYNLTKNAKRKLNKVGFEPFVPSVKGKFYGADGNGSLFMLEKVAGKTLHRFVPEATPEQLKLIREKLVSYADALEHVGIVHGDLNPNNIMIEVLPDGTLKIRLIDFGRGRYTTNRVVGGQTLSQWPTTLRCAPGKSRYCKLVYTWSNRTGNLPTGVRNQNFVEALFGKKGAGIASRASRLKNAVNIIIDERRKLFKASNNYPKTIKDKRGLKIGTVTINGQKGKLKSLLEFFKNENSRIKTEILPLLVPGRSLIKNNNPTVQDFIWMLRGIKNNKNAPLFTPTSTQEQQVRNLYTALTRTPSPKKASAPRAAPEKASTLPNSKEQRKRILMNKIRTYFQNSTNPVNNSIDPSVAAQMQLFIKYYGGTYEELKKLKKPPTPKAPTPKAPTPKAPTPKAPNVVRGDVLEFNRSSIHKAREQAKEKAKQRVLYNNLMRMQKAEQNGAKANANKKAGYNNLLRMQKAEQNAANANNLYGSLTRMQQAEQNAANASAVRPRSRRVTPKLTGSMRQRVNRWKQRAITAANNRKWRQLLGERHVR